MLHCFKLFSVALVFNFNCRMCVGYRWIVCAASVLGLIQSVIWTGLSIAGALLYLGVITIRPYEAPTDFFRVTLIKLYFEGKNKIDGSYLGKFNEDCRNPDVIDLLSPDKVFAVLIAYVILNVFYFFISILLCSNKNPKNLYEGRRLLDIAVGWGCMTLLLCAIDGIFMYFLLEDFMDIKDYVNKSQCKLTNDVTETNCNHAAELPYIPLALALISARFVVLWVWNFIVGCYILFDSMCCKKILKGLPKHEKECEQEERHPVPPKTPQVLPPPPVKLINKSYSTTYDVRKDRDTVDVTRSMEAVTSFSDDFGKTRGSRVYRREWEYAPSEGSLHSASWHPKLQMKEWSAINEGYESDEDGSVMGERVPASHQSEASGLKKLKIVKPPLGKPVSIPVPPPLPANHSSNC